MQYFSLEMIRQRVFLNTIVSMNCFATSQVAIWCRGTRRSPLASGWRTLWAPLALGIGRAWAGTKSDSRNMLMVDYCCLSNCGAMAPAGCHRFGNEVHATTVLAGLRFFGTGTLVVRTVLSEHSRSRCRSSCWLSKLSSSISDDKVDYPVSSLSSSLISWSVSS